jgi:hypothetical protein
MDDLHARRAADGSFHGVPGFCNVCRHTVLLSSTCVAAKDCSTPVRLPHRTALRYSSLSRPSTAVARVLPRLGAARRLLAGLHLRKCCTAAPQTPHTQPHCRIATKYRSGIRTGHNAVLHTTASADAQPHALTSCPVGAALQKMDLAKAQQVSLWLGGVLSATVGRPIARSWLHEPSTLKRLEHQVRPRPGCGCLVCGPVHEWGFGPPRVTWGVVTWRGRDIARAS